MRHHHHYLSILAGLALFASACDGELGAPLEGMGTEEPTAGSSGTPSPNTPSDPAEPNPSDPSDPSDPVDPANPVDPSDPMDPTDPSEPMGQLIPAYVYGAKVKNLLLGAPLTDSELSAISEDPDSFQSYVESWIDQPAAKEKLRAFFDTAFQQEGFDGMALATQVGLQDMNLGRHPGDNSPVGDYLVRNFEESFGRTAIYALENGWSFEDLVKTNRYMMTTAMMVLMGANDEILYNDNGNRSHRTLGGARIEYQRNTDFPLNRVLNPNDNAFLRFYVGDDRVLPGNCNQSGATAGDIGRRVLETIFGRHRPIGNCRGQQSRVRSLLQASDFNDWRLVTVRRPGNGENADRFYRVNLLRNQDELLLNTRRAGFFTTMAFLARWETNEDNQARGTLNQTLITAYGQSIDGAQVIIPDFSEALDGEHADPSTTCYACHKTLDPMRQFFRRDYTFSFHQQRSQEVRDIPAEFAWDGVQATGNTIEDFAELLAGHPNLARGWTQKVCFYANSAPCASGPEFDRVVQAFRDSNMSFRTMMVELFSSPLVTGAAYVEENNGDRPSIARTRHFCATLESRLGVRDPCGIESMRNADRTALGRDNIDLATVVPDDTFSRGDADPVTISDVSLFVRSAFERICTNAANRIVNADHEKYSPQNPEGAIEALTTELMGLPLGDPRRDAAMAILQEHYDAAFSVDSDAATSLRSTFIVACLAPSVVSIGF